MEFIEFRVKINIDTDRRIARLLPDLAASRGRRRLTKSEVVVEAVEQWLAIHTPPPEGVAR